MEGERDRFGEFMKLLERAKEDIYFAARDQELLAQLKERLTKLDKPEGDTFRPYCPKCHGVLESYMFMKLPLERCQVCGGVWFDKEEIAAIAGLVGRSPRFSRCRGFREAGRSQRIELTVASDEPVKGAKIFRRGGCCALQSGTERSGHHDERTDQPAKGKQMSLAEDVMAAGRIRHVPILDGEHLVGVLSQADLFHSAFAKAMHLRPREPTRPCRFHQDRGCHAYLDPGRRALDDGKEAWLPARV
jgi:Zn-finger nucleic acid-binding protein